MARRRREASLWCLHLNSLTSARAFFRSEGQPARDNDFAVGVSGKLWRGSSLTWDGSLQATRGVVNGSIPAPLAVDPRLRAIVVRILGSYPKINPIGWISIRGW